MVNALVFIHGWASSPEIWQGQKEYFSKFLDVVLPDVSSAKNMEEAKCIISASIADRDNCVLIGWSLGWLFAMECLKDLKVKPAGLVSVNSTPKFVNDGYLGNGPKNTHLAKVIRDTKRDPRKAFDDFYKTMILSSSSDAAVNVNLKDLQYDNLIYGLDILKFADYREFIEKIYLPTLLICGLSDKICPKEASEYMYRKIPNSKLKIFNCGHMPFLTNTEEFNCCIDSFIKGL